MALNRGLRYCRAHRVPLVLTLSLQKMPRPVRVRAFDGVHAGHGVFDAASGAEGFCPSDLVTWIENDEAGRSVARREL